MPLKAGQLVLIDTNSLIEAHRISCLTAVTKFYRIATVEKCVEETQTGFQRREPEQTIDLSQLKSILHAVESVSELQEAELTLQLSSGPHLDDGERHLIAHALSRADTWLLCGPDKASIKALHKLGQIDRVVTLEALMRDAGMGRRQIEKLAPNYTDAWLAKLRTSLALGL